MTHFTTAREAFEVIKVSRPPLFGKPTTASQRDNLLNYTDTHIFTAKDIKLNNLLSDTLNLHTGLTPYSPLVEHFKGGNKIDEDLEDEILPGVSSSSRR